MAILRSHHKAGKTTSEAKSFKELVSLLSTVPALLTTGVVHGHILWHHFPSIQVVRQLWEEVPTPGHPNPDCQCSMLLMTHVGTGWRFALE
jgi:hypothetical protein